MAGFSLTGGTGMGFNLGGSETEGFSLPSDTSNPSSIYALDTPMSATGGSYAGYMTDYQESSKISPFYPPNGASWWENLAAYGATRAIDAHFGAVQQDKTTAGATYAGQNGQTYPAGPAQVRQDGGLMLLLVLGALVYAVAD